MSGVKEFAREWLPGYEYPDKTQAAVQELGLYFKGLDVRLCRNDEECDNLLTVKGDIPTKKGEQYITFQVWFLKRFPVLAPLIRLKIGRHMMVNPSCRNIVAPNIIRHDYLTHWDSRTSTLADCLQLLMHDFSETVPVFRLNEFSLPSKVKILIEDLVREYPDFKMDVAKLASDGYSEQMIIARGVIIIKNKSRIRKLPCHIWLHKQFPAKAPLVYIRMAEATTPFLIGQPGYSQKKYDCHYLRSWHRNESSLPGLINEIKSEHADKTARPVPTKTDQSQPQNPGQSQLRHTGQSRPEQAQVTKTLPWMLPGKPKTPTQPVHSHPPETKFDDSNAPWLYKKQQQQDKPPMSPVHDRPKMKLPPNQNQVKTRTMPNTKPTENEFTDVLPIYNPIPEDETATISPAPTPRIPRNLEKVEDKRVGRPRAPIPPPTNDPRPPAPTSRPTANTQLIAPSTAATGTGRPPAPEPPPIIKPPVITDELFSFVTKAEISNATVQCLVENGFTSLRPVLKLDKEPEVLNALKLPDLAQLVLLRDAIKEYQHMEKDVYGEHPAKTVDNSTKPLSKPPDDKSDGIPMDAFGRAFQNLLNDMTVDEACVQQGSQIGRGEFGVVYKGKYNNPHSGLLEDIAIKTISLDKTDDAKIEGFVKEIFHLRPLKHKNIVELKGIMLVNKQPRILMPYMSQGDLKKFVKDPKKDFSVLDLLTLGMEVAKGMKYLSDHSFIHGDLAARNCLVDASGTVKVSDFGLSKQLFASDYFKYDPKASSRPIRWMAIECIEEFKYTLKSDVWAFGILLWELMTRGKQPYPDFKNNAQLVGALTSGYRMSCPKYTSEEIYNIMLICWEKEQDRRPSFDDLCKMIANVLSEGQAASSKSQAARTKSVQDETDTMAFPVQRKSSTLPSDSSHAESSSGSSKPPPLPPRKGSNDPVIREQTLEGEPKADPDYLVPVEQRNYQQAESNVSQTATFLGDQYQGESTAHGQREWTRSLLPEQPVCGAHQRLSPRPGPNTGAATPKPKQAPLPPPRKESLPAANVPYS